MPVSPRQAAERLLHATIGPDPGDIADCYAPDVVIDYTNPITGARLLGRLPELLAALGAGPAPS
jgi:hypothetical protein